MNDSHSGEIGAFPSTHWSLVELAGRDESQQRVLLAEFLRRYMPPLRAHLTIAKRLKADRAEDLLQGFICDKVLQDRILTVAREGRGRLRSFLRKSLNNYVIFVMRREKAHKRSPKGGNLLSFEEDIDTDPPAEEADLFDLAWARQVVQDAADRMKAECRRSQRSDVWVIFDARILARGNGEAPTSYEELVQQLGLASPSQASNLLITAKRMYERHLRAVVGEYAGTPDLIDAELQDLRRIVAAGRA